MFFVFKKRGVGGGGGEKKRMGGGGGGGGGKAFRLGSEGKRGKENQVSFV